jgi:hypothetical protein
MLPRYVLEQIWRRSVWLSHMCSLYLGTSSTNGAGMQYKFTIPEDTMRNTRHTYLLIMVGCYFAHALLMLTDVKLLPKKRNASIYLLLHTYESLATPQWMHLFSFFIPPIFSVKFITYYIFPLNHIYSGEAVTTIEKLPEEKIVQWKSSGCVQEKRR